MNSLVINEGIKRIYKEDLETQKHYIDTIMKEARNSDSSIIYKAEGFFVPNDKYMVEYFGNEITNQQYDCYGYYGDCKWTGNLVLPLRDVKNNIVGFVGYNPFIAIENKEKGIWDNPYYKQSDKKVLNKSLFLFGLKDYFKRAMKEGYIIITDGVFDLLSCEREGLVAGALLGSYVSDALLFQLSFIPKVIVAMDNDDAGLKVLNYLKKYLPRTIALKQGKFKDIDDLLKSDLKDLAIKQIKENLNKTEDIRLRF
ncbi:toprim domain-containing protein [uncultured Clostridium sp.]|uniref:toprim domain-containing protein n=1 Tax=uncultured Clostridium sp. TaxID=59620 RepID=UPI0026F3CD8E|nr:toprim domain-containing protein [uncultured Clostridium sp.]